MLEKEKFNGRVLIFPLLEIELLKINVNLKKGDENKIDVLYYKITNIKKTLEHVSRITSININVFVLKKITKKSQKHLII